MRVAVFSDSHGSVEPMRRAIREQEPELVLFLGDGWRDIETLRGEFPALPFRSVRGNCDIGGDAPDKLFFELEGVSIFMTLIGRAHF